MTATGWTIIIVAVIAFLAFVIWCQNRLEMKRVEVEITKARPRQTLFGEVERHDPAAGGSSSASDTKLGASPAPR